MTKVHYSPYSDEDESYSERAMCGVRVGESYQYDNRWNYVTCKLCEKNRDKIESSIKVEEETIVDQMGDMVEFLSC
ncbi:hypothetical protein NVP1201B_15 [Vibrio phage 1.201.B._10N.286.55.F1]|nr:hypothetical protein NVP1201B_15 [Vibrio phage 1.201.B._10N.286.55.F1]